MGFLTVENFLWVQAGLVLLAAMILFRKNKTSGARLRWKKGSLRETPKEMTGAPRMWGNQTPLHGVTRLPMNHDDLNTARVLNVHFNFNGHSWDAFEVLGLPAGSSADKVEAAYRTALSRSEAHAHEFYQLARDAIRKQSS